MMLEILKKLTGGPKAATAAELRAALAELDAAALAAAVEAAKSDVGEAILSGAEKAVERAEAALEIAERNRDRANVARAELEKRLAATEAAEASAILDAERAAVEAEAARVAAEVRKKWPGLQRQMVALLDQLSDAETAVRALNAKLHAAGRTDTLADVEWRARPRPAFAWEGAVALSANVAMPEVPEWNLAGYGPPLTVSSAFYTEPQRGPSVTENWPAPRVVPGPVTTFPRN